MPDSIALILLASGLSRRFGGDKLMADYKGAPLLSHAAQLGTGLPITHRFGVVGRGQHERRTLLEGNGYETIQNAAPETGQASSLILGIKTAKAAGANGAIILLGDMPDVPAEHIQRLAEKSKSADAIMTNAGDILSPPAYFPASLFDQLMSLSGDQGARRVFLSAENTATIDLAPAFARDIDTPADLETAEALHG